MVLRNKVHKIFLNDFMWIEADHNKITVRTFKTEHTDDFLRLTKDDF